MNTSESPPDGVWFRNSPHTADTNRITGLGVYRNETVQLTCYAWGDSVGAYNNTLWYYVNNLSRPTNSGSRNSGYLNAHYINDGLLANQIDAGVPQCGGTPPPAPPPDGASVYYSGKGDAGYDLAKPFASAILTEDGSRGYPDWAQGSCSSAWSNRYSPVIGNRTVSTLSGWSLGRLGPIYLLAQDPGRSSNVHYILMFDPGNYAQLSGCDRSVNATQLLANWLSSNSANRLVIMAGQETKPKSHRGIQEVYFPAIRGRAIAQQVLVCNVENNGVPWSHRDVLKGYNWMMNQPPPSKCPSNFLGWHP